MKVAYTIAPSHWGQGLGAKAAQAILDYGFDTLGLTRLVCLIDEENAASIRVAEKICRLKKQAGTRLGHFGCIPEADRPGPRKEF